MSRTREQKFWSWILAEPNNKKKKRKNNITTEFSLLYSKRKGRGPTLDMNPTLLVFFSKGILIHPLDLIHKSKKMNSIKSQNKTKIKTKQKTNRILTLMPTLRPIVN